MKKIVAVLLALVMLLGMAACGEQKPKPEDTVKAFCEGMKNFDIPSMQACVDGEFDLSESMFEEAAELTGLPDYLKACAADLKYTIGDAAATGDIATVKVDFSYADASEILGEAFYDFFVKAMELMFSGASEDETSDVFDPILQEKIASVERGVGEASVDFVLKQIDENWKIIEVPESIITILTCDMEKGMELMSEKMASAFEENGWTSSEMKEAVEYPIRDEVLFDNEYAKMSIVSGGSDEWGDVVFKVLCENKTEDKELNFTIDRVVMNNWTTSVYMSEYVAAGKNANAQFTIFSSDLERIGLEAPEKLSFIAKVGDEDSWLTDEYLVSDNFVVYPTGLSESEIDMSVRTSAESDEVIVDQDGIYFAFTSAETDEGWGNFVVHTYIRNDSGMDLNFNMDDVSVDGYMLDPYWGSTVYSGTQNVSEVIFYASDLEENGIDVPSEIEFDLRVADNNDWEKDDIINKTFVFTP